MAGCRLDRSRRQLREAPRRIAEFLLRDTLASLEDQLDPERFARIHRSAIVQIDRITEIHPATHGDADLVLRTGATLVLSRTWRDRLVRLIR